MLITLIKLIIENLIDFTFDNCLSKGGEGNNVANDLEEEHFVQFAKKLLKRMAAQKTLRVLEWSTSANTGLRKIIEKGCIRHQLLTPTIMQRKTKKR